MYITTLIGKPIKYAYFIQNIYFGSGSNHLALGFSSILCISVTISIVIILFNITTLTFNSTISDGFRVDKAYILSIQSVIFSAMSRIDFVLKYIGYKMVDYIELLMKF